MNFRLNSMLPFVATALFAGIVLTALAPYGSISLPIPARFGYWFGLVLVGDLGVMACDKIMQKLGFGGSKLLRALRRSIGSSLGVFAVLLMMAISLGHTVTLTGGLLLLFYIWVVGFTICFVATFVDKAPAVGTRPALYERLKPALRKAELYALSAEDHYVRVITSNGDDLVLMRLGDAIKEVSPLPGLSPHRSWWVAEAGVKTVRKHGGKTVIILKNDTEVPVSRGAQKTVRDAGWV